MIKKYTKKNISIIPVEDKKPNKSFIDTRNELDFIIPSYEVMIRKMIDMMLQNKEIYEQHNLNSR